MKCPNCGTENASGVNFCVSCGSQLPIETVNTCPNCGTQNSPDVAFCVNCGMPLASGQQNNPPMKKSAFDFNAIKEKVLPIVKNKFVLLGAGALVLVIILISVISAIIGSNNGYIELDRYINCYESDGKIYISSDGKLLKTTVPGENAASGASIDGKYLYIKNDEKDLYVVNGNKVQKVASDVDDVELAVTGGGLLYTTKTEDDEIELFHYVLGKKAVSVADGSIVSYSISPDGKSAAYTISDEDSEKTQLYFFDGTKSNKIVSSKLILGEISNDGKYIYFIQTNDDGDSYLYSYNKKGEKTKLGEIGFSFDFDDISDMISWGLTDTYSIDQILDGRLDLTLYYNADHTQVLFYHDGKTYISENGKDAGGCTKNKRLTLLNTENAYDFRSTYPVDSLYDHVYYSDDDTWFIRKNSDKSVKLAPKASNLQLDSTASYLYYTYDNDELRMIKISDGENASDKAVTIINECVSDYVVTSDRSLVYYTHNYELYSANGKKGKSVKRISNDDLDSVHIYISSNNTVFYSMDGDLYACSNGKKGKKVLSDGYILNGRYIDFENGYIHALQDDTVWITNSKKFKKLITIEEE